MYTFKSQIRYSECDSQAKLTLAALLNYFQDCSTFQSEALGVGGEYLTENNLVWVLSSWQIVVNRYPGLCEEVETGTFPYGFKGCFGYRNFLMMTRDGEILAQANSLWTLLNLQQQTMAHPTEKMKQVYALEEKLSMDYAPRKITVPDGGIYEEPIIVKKHHLDTNNHVNNGQFVDMAMNSLAADFAIGQMRAEYRKQAHLGDELKPYVVRTPGLCIVSLQNPEGTPYAVVEFAEKERKT
ncbi:MAG: acyl-[acyl-carrier-protein] thioesterase [Acetatifactor sp.]|nr:acyl-[acyl-carrier-protein] thioesterase [Acetatifactor sp.]